MSTRILITGGAGFIGSHVADELLRHGYHVRVLDVFSPQVHGDRLAGQADLPPEVECIYGDIRDATVVRRALEGVEAVYHFAAAVGVGQSMYEPERYSGTNTHGTAVLLRALIEHPVAALIVASSMSVYGEGLYRTQAGGLYAQAGRSMAQLKAGCWEPYDAGGHPLRPVATPETKPPSLASVYALTKYDQERLCLMIGQAYAIPTVALRFFNVYGPRQALSNPYTGVLAIFAARYLNNRPAMIFEDGYQQRDFVSVHDIARACRLALEVPQAAGGVFNIGSGQALTVRQVAEHMARVLHKEDMPPCITGKYRVGDIRHCFADISRARTVLGYEPQVSFETGLIELVDWLAGQSAYDYVDIANEELAKRGLTI